MSRSHGLHNPPIKQGVHCFFELWCHLVAQEWVYLLHASQMVTIKKWKVGLSFKLSHLLLSSIIIL